MSAAKDLMSAGGEVRGHAEETRSVLLSAYGDDREPADFQARLMDLYALIEATSALRHQIEKIL